jgi:hypothetical protein
MPPCPTCGEQAEYKVYIDDSYELPAGPALRICHSTKSGAYIHVLGDDDE